MLGQHYFPPYFLKKVATCLPHTTFPWRKHSTSLSRDILNAHPLLSLPLLFPLSECLMRFKGNKSWSGGVKLGTAANSGCCVEHYVPSSTSLKFSTSCFHRKWNKILQHTYLQKIPEYSCMHIIGMLRQWHGMDVSEWVNQSMCLTFFLSVDFPIVIIAQISAAASRYKQR